MRISFNTRQLISRACAVSLAINLISANAQLAAPESSAPSEPDLAPAPIPVSAAVPAQPAPQTRLRFDRGTYKPGIETLRVVRRESTMTNVAGQVALGVAVSLLSGGISFGGRGFSKDELAGDTLEELKNDPVAINPAMSELNDALSIVATDIYRRRAAAARDVALKDGSTREEIEEASLLPKEADTPLHPRAWHLVYENLSGSDEMFRLMFGAELGRAGFRRPPAVCAYQSEPIAWSDWQANQWQRLRDERAKAVAQCATALAETPEQRW